MVKMNEYISALRMTCPLHWGDRTPIHHSCCLNYSDSCCKPKFHYAP